MSVLKNARHEKFAQARAEGKTVDAAYTAAGYKSHSSNAARMSGNDSVCDRVAELQSKAANTAVLTLETHLETLASLGAEARAAGSFAAAITAERHRGQAVGLYVERTQIVDRDFVVCLPEKIEDTEEWVKRYGNGKPTTH